MRAADKAQLRLRVGIFPDDGVICLDSLELGVVYNVDLRALGDDALALLDGLGREIFDVIQADSAV